MFEIENCKSLLTKDVLKTLLKDRNTGKNLMWCTDNYKKYDESFISNSEIPFSAVSNISNSIIQPRVNKTKEEQTQRIKDKAEVFTPVWMCNLQINAIDDEWFGHTNVFNVPSGEIYKTNYERIDFSKYSKTANEYINDIRLEISCGEAPYLTSRYDAVSGKKIEIKDRVGFFDRKLRVVNENSSKENWCENALIAVQTIYGYDWQGDNVFLSRLNLLYSVIENYEMLFQKLPCVDFISKVVEILSWNIWQMDGIKFVVPETCKEEKIMEELSLFDANETITVKQCPGCVNENVFKHNGIYCKVMDWKENKKIRFVDLLNER